MVEGSLTTRFVYDWRLKSYRSYEVKSENQEDGSASVSSVKRWMRRSRFCGQRICDNQNVTMFTHLPLDVIAAISYPSFSCKL